MDLIKIKNSYSFKENVKKIKRQSKNWGAGRSDKVLLSRIYKEFSKLNKKTT